MSGPAPLQPQGPLILEALRLVEGASTLEASLAATPGAELKAVLTEINAQGLLLLLADGRSLTASGELPYPTGTELTFRIQPQTDGSTQLQTLRADPPPPPALLAPLVQGEATALLQRLSAPDLPAALLPLKALLDRLPAPPPLPAAEPLPAPLLPLAEALALPTAQPAPSELGRTTEASVQGTPMSGPAPNPAAASPAPLPALPNPAPLLPSLQSLATVLEQRGLPPEPARTLAALLVGEPAVEPAPSPRTDLPLDAPAQGTDAKAQAWVLAPALEPPPQVPRSEPPPLPTTALPEDPSQARALLRAFGLPEGIVAALVPDVHGAASNRGIAPSSSGDSPEAEATASLREVLDRLPAPLAQRVLALLTLLPPPGQGQALPRQDPLAQLIRALLPQLQPATEGASLARATATSRPGTPEAQMLSPSEPATWSRWMKEVTATLSRPEASPAEAGFHRLQAREGTALFEIPLPWASEPSTLELWAERDADGPSQAEVSRVLLAVSLGHTGELRVALQAGPAGVQAQIVASPEVAARLESLLREELGEPSPFPLSVRAAAILPPRPRAMAGTGLQALG